MPYALCPIPYALYTPIVPVGSQPDYEVAIERDVMIPMRDGARLASDIYHPAHPGRDGRLAPGRWPCLLERTPYDKLRPERVEHALFFARRGYTVAMQDTRGRFRSEGEFYLFKNEAPDGYDTVEWLAARPWSDGQIGTFGYSYMAWVQNALACLNPPHLKAMVPHEGIFNAHTSAFRHAGAMEMRFIAWAFHYACEGKEAQADPLVAEALKRVSFRDWLSRMPIREGLSPLALAASYERWALEILTHADYDEYWKGPGFNPEEHAEHHSDVPTLYSGAWYDSYARSTLDSYQCFSSRKREPVHVIMGPWTHGDDAANLSWAGDVEFGSEAALSSQVEGGYYGLLLRWFDHWLKGLPTEVERQAPVRIFVMGGGDGHRTSEGRLFHGGRWRDEHEWPLARTRYTPYYLRAGGRLSLHAQDGDELPDSYTYDPEQPVPTIGGSISSLYDLAPIEEVGDLPSWERVRQIVRVGPWHQAEDREIYGARPPYLPLASRPDVLVYQTPPLAQDVEVTGPISFVFWASSSAVDTDFTAKLIDVYPPNPDYPQGYHTNITDSLIRARYRASRERAELMRPGEVYEFTMTLYPTSNLFKAGHRIRLDISSSNWPRFDLNPNTGEPLGRNRRWLRADNTIYHEARRPSHIVLPVIPRNPAQPPAASS